MSNKNDKISPLGERILQELKRQRFKKKNLYDGLGISRGTLDNWIAGTTTPSHEEVAEMSKILSIDLLHGQSKPKVKTIELDAWEELIATRVEFQKTLKELIINNQFFKEDIETHAKEKSKILDQNSRLLALVERLTSMNPTPHKT